MGELIKVQGDIDNIFSSVDFYQNLSVVGLVSIEELRKSYIEMYFKDYTNRYNLKKNKFKADKNKKLVETEPVKEDVLYVQNGIFVDDEVQETEVKETPQETGVQDGAFVDNDEVQETGVQNVEYVNHGVVLEDLQESEQELLVTPDVEYDYVPHGVFVDDTDLEVPEEQNNDKDISDESEDYFVEDDGLFEEEAEYYSDSSITEEDDYAIDSESTDTMVNDEDVVISDNLNVSKEEKTVTSEVNIDSEKSYRDVREYVKFNSGCSINDVKKYFSARDIQKALMNSKIVEKKNKLYVV